MGRDITHNLRAAMYSPADQSLNDFSKHQELLLPYTSTWIGRTNLDIGCGTGLTSVIHHQKLGSFPTICDIIDMRHVLALPLPFHLIADETLPFEVSLSTQAISSTYFIICRPHHKWFDYLEKRSEPLTEW